MDNFFKEIGEYRYVSNEVNMVKQNIMENKKLILIFQEDFDKKLSEMMMKNSNFNNLYDSMRVNLDVVFP
jgi:hypothetical protein